MPYPVLLPKATWYKGTVDKGTITKIDILDSYTPTGYENESWNADTEDVGAIKCYRTGTVLTIAGDGSGMISANEDSSSLFGRFGKTTHITGATLLDVSNVSNLSYAFVYCESLISVDVSNWNTENVTDMSGVFYLCGKLVNVDVSGWKTGSVATMYAMFGVCASLEKLDLSGWDISACTSLSYIFYDCSSLKSIDVSKWDTSAVTNVSYMFYYCSSLKSIDVSKWDTSAVTNVSYMFCGCSSLETLDVSKWDTSAVTDVSYMFYDCSSLKKIVLGTNFTFVGSNHMLPTPTSGYWYDIDKETFAPTGIPNGAGTYFASTDIVDREAAKPMIVTQGSMLRTAKAIRTKAGNRTGYKPSEFPDGILAIG